MSVGVEQVDPGAATGPAFPEHLAARVTVEPPTSGLDVRPRVGGKFLFAGTQKLYVRGVTYGAFRPDADGNEYHDLAQVERDFAQMAANGLNAVRIPHTMPPRALLDLAARHGLRVMVGLSAEQYVGYLIDRQGAPDVEALVRDKVRKVAGHPALLCYALGNEVPAPLVRLIGRRRVERYLERLYRAVKAEDPAGIVTYVNYPTTEYLELPFLDLLAFNVYLETEDRLEAYLARLQNLAGERPLLMSELGLDSHRNGLEKQAEVLDWQIRAAFRGGCAGAFVFAWTDEWHRHGEGIEDWKFGLTDEQRHPKPALAAARRAFAEVPFADDRAWPSISVVVCSLNGERTIRDTCEALSRLDYPNYEVIVVDDGSTDRTAAIGIEYGCRVISTENRGLSSARNTGLAAARGEIVAYTDDDAYPDPHWLRYLADTFMTTDYVGVGGPNLPPPGDGPIAECVANAPGGPIHVLLTDTEAEHIPGCNMAFRKAALEAIGGFDPQFRAAGDDVDICWRLEERGWKIGFNPAALVWHHRRDSLRAYWKQQIGYGKAEALLERKWPARYNAVGHIPWSGRVYGKEHTRALNLGRSRVYQGIWGTAPFQSLYQPAPSLLGSLPLMPEWYLVTVGLAALTALGLFWRPMLLLLPLLVLAIGGSVAQATVGAANARYPDATRSCASRLKRHLLTGVLHLLQPLARLRGRVNHGLTPWRPRAAVGLAVPWPRRTAVLTQEWRSREARLEQLEAVLLAQGAAARRGGDYDDWDLEVPGGLFGSVRLLLATEDYGEGWQLVRIHSRPRWSPSGLLLSIMCAVAAAEAGIDAAWPAALVLGVLATLVDLRMLWESATAAGALVHALGAIKAEQA